ncbi:poly [ADP-ribose] polymerase [Elysia marginata]|uniref:Poly [ADP-ribose] polymerase n=1 Tax=Elysia marginata TaxID=1093978 RepID=A0AAV4H030_9GAST|nr:poly [ADP-ribose] polymerase [Elysia marginata]
MVSSLVLNNLPKTYTEERIKDYVEGTLDIDVKDVVLHHTVLGKALITFDIDIDFATTTEVLKDFPVEKRNVNVQKTSEKPFTVIVKDVEPEYLSEEFLEIYFCAQFGDGEDIVSSCQMLQKFKMAVVTFKTDETVMKRILTEHDHVPLPSENYQIVVEPYYIHFHDCHDQQGGDYKLAQEGLHSLEAQVQKRNDSSEELDSSKQRGLEELTEKKQQKKQEEICEDQYDYESENEQGKQEDEDDDDDKGEDKFFDTENRFTETNSFSGERGFQIPEKKLRVFHRGNYSGRKMHGNRKSNHQNECTRVSSHARGEKETEYFPPVIQLHKSNHCVRGSSSSAVRGRGRAAVKIFQNDTLQKNQNNDFMMPVDEKSEDEDEKKTVVSNNKQSVNTPRKSLSQHCLARGGRSFPSQHGRYQNDAGRTLDSNFQGQTKIFREVCKDYKEPEEKEPAVKTFTQKEHVGKFKSMLLRHCEGDFEECKVRYDPEHETFLFEGKEECVRERHLMLLTEVKKIKEEHVVLKPSMIEILSTLWQQQCIEKLGDLIRNFESKVLFEKFTLKILANGEDNLKSARDVVHAEINGVEHIKIQATITEVDFQSIKTFTECKFPVIVSRNMDGILIEGMRENMKKAAESIADRLVNLLSVTKKFEINSPLALYFNKVLMDKILLKFKGIDINIQERSDKTISFTLSGKKPLVEGALKELNIIVSKCSCKSWDLYLEFPREDFKLMADSLSKSTQCISQFENKNHCSVSLKLPSSASFPRQNVAKFRDKGAKKIKRTFSKKQFNTKGPIEQQKPLMYNLSSTCQLILQSNAKIAQENSAVLVCVLDQKVDLRKTSVGKDFLTACPTLWKQLQEVQKGSAPGTSVLVTKGPFNGLPSTCQAVYHAILSKWLPDSPDASEANLAQVVKTIVTNATTSGVTSISIPPLGRGRLLGYPSSSVAQVMIQMLQATIQQSSIRKVVLVADPQLLVDYKGEAQKVFSSAASASVSTLGNESKEGETEFGDHLAKSDSETEESDSSDDGGVADGYSDKEERYVSPHNQSSSSATIWTDQTQSLDQLWTMLKKIISAQSLHVKYFNQSDFDVWPKHFRDQICLEGKQRSLWVEPTQNPKTNTASFICKGEENAVRHMMEFINSEHKSLLSKRPKRIASSRAKRGTLEFIEHAASSTELFPSYWKMSKKESDNPGFLQKWLKKWKGPSKPDSNYLVDVNDATKAAIVKLVSQDLFDPSLVGHGNDAVSLNHKGIQVTDVKRVENPVLFELYNENRKRLFEYCHRNKKICSDIKSVKGSKGRVATTELLPGFMKTELYWEVNEHYLFHGSQYIDTLVTSGPDPRVGSEGGMFGRGFYLAEMSTKADQYADNKQNRSPLGKPLTLIMFRALLGNPFFCDHNHPSVQSKGSKKLSRPPCMKCLDDKCKCHPQPLFDSVIGDGKWLFREFVLYEKNQCYPEYVVTYKRV